MDSDLIFISEGGVIQKQFCSICNTVNTNALAIVLIRASEKSLRVETRRVTESNNTAHCIAELEGVAGRPQVFCETGTSLEVKTIALVRRMPPRNGLVK